MEVYQQYVLSVGCPMAVSKLTPTHLEAQRPSRPRYPRTKCVNHPVHICVIMNAMINGICLHCCSAQPLNLISYATTSAVFRARRVTIHCRHVAGQRELRGSRVWRSRLEHGSARLQPNSGLLFVPHMLCLLYTSPSPRDRG